MDIHSRPPATHQRFPSFLSTSLFFKSELTYPFSSLLVILAVFLLLNTLTPFQPISILQFAFPSVSLTRHPNECDYSDGKWVWDESYAIGLYSEDCPFLDPGFQCHRNGRNDTGYRNWRWQPHGCDLPRFNAKELLERSRNGRIVFVGDSIGRNQWESFVCMLSTGVTNKTAIYEANGNPITKHKGFLSIRFHDYNMTVEYYRTPFLVVIGRPPKNSSQIVQKAIRLDTPQWLSKRWIGADVIVFNTGHWWNRNKTIDQGIYFQIGEALNMTMDVKDAFQKTMQTIKQWAVSNMQLDKNFLFFRSYSPSHYRNGTWDTGGSCDCATEPETNKTSFEADPWQNRVTSNVFERTGKNVQFLNITYLSESRIDGHPSSHREPGTPVDAPQDCSHWCLPGVPDVWNELLSASLLSKGYDTRRRS